MARPDVRLSEVQLVQPATAALQNAVWGKFLVWIDAGAGDGAASYATAVPNVLVELLYMRLWSGSLLGRSPFAAFPSTACYSAASCPSVQTVVEAWMGNSYKAGTTGAYSASAPLLEPLFESMCSLALGLGWYRWVCVTLLGFYGCCRIGEVLRATRADLQTPCDLLRSDTRFFLQIKEPKTKHRGPRVQHVVVVLPEKTAQFVQRVCGKLPRCASLFYGSPAVYRKRWDCLLERLGISQSFRLTPGSLRGGGAVATCPAGPGLESLLFNGG